MQTVYADGSRQYSAWSFSGEKTGESVAGVVTGLPADCRGVKVEIVVNAAPGENGTEAEDVYRVCLSQGTGEISGVPVRNAVAAGLRTIGLEAYCAADPRLPLTVRIERLSGDPDGTDHGAGSARRGSRAGFCRSGCSRLQFLADDPGDRQYSGLRLYAGECA